MGREKRRVIFPQISQIPLICHSVRIFCVTCEICGRQITTFAFAKTTTTMSTNSFRDNMSASLDKAKEKTRRVFRYLMWGLLIVGILSGVGYYFYRTFPKGDKEVSGTLFKLSYEGYVFKTYEGQLHLIGSTMMTTQSTWDFSVKNEEVYKAMQPFVGKQVKLFYKELPEAAFPWEGKTAFIIYRVEALP